MAAANRIAHVLVEDLGIVPGNRVLLRGPNNQWLSAAWFGVLKAGAVLVTTMPLLRTGELQTIHEIAHLDAALVDHRFLEAVEPLGVPTLAFGDDAWAERLAAKDRGVRRRADLQRRRLHARLHLRHHRSARRRRCTSTAT